LDRLRARPQGVPRQPLRRLSPGPRLLEALALARGDGRDGRLLKALGRVQLLILDDWHERGSSIVTCQVPVDHWHEVIGDSTLS
jgi:hypothetical protein